MEIKMMIYLLKSFRCSRGLSSKGGCLRSCGPPQNTYLLRKVCLYSTHSLNLEIFEKDLATIENAKVAIRLRPKIKRVSLDYSKENKLSHIL